MGTHADSFVVLHFRDGVTQRCCLVSEFSPRDSQIEIDQGEQGRQAIHVNDLKAVFFPKHPRQRQADLDREDESTPSRRTPVARVEFFDGEIIVGRVESYSIENSGFWLYPTAPDSNNDRIFVVARALHTVSLEG
jgi:hypothetical protein